LLKILLRITTGVIKIQCALILIAPVVLQAQYLGGLKNDKGVAFCEVNSNYYLVGNTRSVGSGSDDVWFIKINNNFKSEYYFDWGGPHHDNSTDIIATSDGNFIVVGHSWDAPGARTGVFVSKYNDKGVVLWSAYFSGIESDYTSSAFETADGGVLITGMHQAEGVFGTAFLIKLNSGGVKQWERYFDTNLKDIGKDVVEGSDLSLYLLLNTGAFVGKIANSSEYKTTPSGIMIIKTDKHGNEIWRKNYGGLNHDFPSKIIQGIDDNFYVVGSTLNNTNGSYDFVLIKIDADGNEIWTKNYGGLSYDYANDIDIDINGDMIITGESNSLSLNINSDIYVVKVDMDGNELWAKSYGGLGSDYGSCGKFLSDGTIGILGSSDSRSNEDKDLYFIKIDSGGEIIDLLNNEIVESGNSDFQQVLIFPNPASTYIRIRLNIGENYPESFYFELFDIAGKLVKSQRIISLSGTVRFNPELPAGVYIYQLKAPMFTFQGKIIIN